MFEARSSRPAWTSLDAHHVWHPYTQAHNAPLPLPIEKGRGAYLYTPDGRAILDGISSWWVNIHGHSVERLNDALAQQARRVAHVMFAGITHEPGAELAAALAQKAGLPRVFYSDNGSTAVEVAMKMAYQSFHNRGQKARRLFVAFEHAYHGDTFGAMAAGGTTLFHGTFSDLLCRVERAHGPACPAQNYAAPCAPDCAFSLERLLERVGQEVAAILLEPMLQGAGGMRISSPMFLQTVEKLARLHGIPLIADEVLTGFGRTGRLFASEYGTIKPDIMCLSKALTGGYLPLGATLATADMYDAFVSDNRCHTFFHGHSFTGNPLACAVALASLALFDDNQCLDRVVRLTELYAKHLPVLEDLPCVESTRHIGADRKSVV